MTVLGEIREAMLKGQEIFALTKKEYQNVYQWTRNERRTKGKDAGIKSCGGGEYLVWHEDFPTTKKKEAEEDVEYVEPKVLREEEHDAYVHICGQTSPFNCGDCSRDKRIACMRDHTTETSLRGFPDHMTREEKLRAYWAWMPGFIGIELRAEEKNPLAV